MVKKNFEIQSIDIKKMYCSSGHKKQVLSIIDSAKSATCSIVMAAQTSTSPPAISSAAQMPPVPTP